MDSEPRIALDPAWPRMTLAETEALLTAPGARFEMETLDIGGMPTRVWKNAPPTLGWLIEASRAHGDRTFTIYEDERVSYDATYRAVAALAATLRNIGVAKGDRVALAMRNLPEWPVVFFAAASIGAIVVPLNAWWTAGELAYGIDDSGAKILILDDERHQRLHAHGATFPGVERTIVTRASVPLGSDAVRLEELIGTPHDYPACRTRRSL